MQEWGSWKIIGLFFPFVEKTMFLSLSSRVQLHFILIACVTLHLQCNDDTTGKSSVHLWLISKEHLDKPSLFHICNTFKCGTKFVDTLYTKVTKTYPKNKVPYNRVNHMCNYVITLIIQYIYK